MKLASRYSEALLELAVEKDKVIALKNDALKLLVVFKLEFLDFFSSSLYDKEVKFKLIRDHLTGRVDVLMLNFVLLILSKGRFLYILDILEQFVDDCNLYLNIKTAVVYSRFKLDDVSLNKVAMTLKSRDGFDYEVKNIIDVSLISGIKVIIEHELIDISLKGKFKALRTELMMEGV